tara:strand:- start:282 stop:983 length:702 start_codon:yes stop_codon:yes gene_type:complete
MKTIILCGGKGTRLGEETQTIPKPMVKVGNKPILSHIINTYNFYGFKEFFIALGYRGNIIKNYFKKHNPKIKIHLVDTGKNTMTGGRLLRLRKYFKKNENFMMTYGDGLTNQNIKKLVSFHLKHKKFATMTIVRPPVRFGEVKLRKNKIVDFKEKPQSQSGWINGGYFVLNESIFQFLKGDKEMFERKPLSKISQKGQLMAYKHNGFWQCMDTPRDKKLLNKMWKDGLAAWKI